MSLSRADPRPRIMPNGGDPSLADARQWDGAVVLVVAPTPSHPQDYGNRKRIYRICRMLKDAGAKIHYLHYPAESEWRGKLPQTAQRQMMLDWDGYYLVPPTTVLHPAPQGDHHRVDEWWDPAIGTAMSWICPHLRPDAVIVNYTWLSRALDFAPPGALRILDTHDRFSGRKEMFQDQGLPPEFFYTTQDQESIALGRADSVWAIKPQEQSLFAALCDTPVITMPHIDPMRPRPAGVQGPLDELRIGIMGAGNLINHHNIAAFFRHAEPIFRRYMPRARIVLGGTIGDRLGHVPQFVTRLGWVDDVADFYDQIDVALIPMAFSTGLKIKTAEAMSFDIPILSHKHAFEGYVPHHPFHQCADFDALAMACVDVASDPDRYLDDLHLASRATHAATTRAVSSGLAATGLRLFAAQNLTLLALHPDATRRGSLYAGIFPSTLEYLAHRGPVAVYLDKISDPDGLPRFCQTCDAATILINPRIQNDLTADQIRQIGDAGGQWRDLEQIFASRAVHHLWLDHLPTLQGTEAPDLARIYLNPAFAMPGMRDLGAPSHATQDLTAGPLAGLLGPLTEVSVIGAEDSAIAGALRHIYGAQAMLSPPFWLRQCQMLRDLEAHDQGFGLTVILPVWSRPLVAFLRDLLIEIGQPLLNVIDLAADHRTIRIDRHAGCEIRHLSRHTLGIRERQMLAEARGSMTFAPQDAFSGLVVALLDGAGHRIIGPRDGRAGPMSLLRLLHMLCHALAQDRPPRDRAAILASQNEFDPGWMRIWMDLKKEAAG